MFERHGIQTIHASTGHAAVELTRRIEPDLLVLDKGRITGERVEKETIASG